LELSKNEIYFSIEEAKKIIIEALSPLGEEYQKVIKKCFNEK
jgi:oligoendopeptidase F